MSSEEEQAPSAGTQVDAGFPSLHDSRSEGDVVTKAVRPGFQFSSVSLICPLIDCMWSFPCI